MLGVGLVSVPWLRKLQENGGAPRGRVLADDMFAESTDREGVIPEQVLEIRKCAKMASFLMEFIIYTT